MTTIQAQPSFVHDRTDWLYRASKSFLTMDDSVDRFFSTQQKKTNSTAVKKVIQPIQSLGKMLTQYDFSQFVDSKTPPARISEPPLGALMLMMYAGLLGARMARAWQRGKPPENAPNQPRDMREVHDVLRRDLWGITFYIFGFGMVNSLLVKWAEKKQNILLRNKQGTAFTFSEHELNGAITNPNILKAHYEQGNKKALLKAASHNGYFGVPQAIQKSHPGMLTQLGEHIEAFRTALSQGKLKDAMNHLNTLDKLRNSVLEDLKNPSSQVGQWSQKAIKRLETRWPQYQTFLSRYLQHRRLPLDIASFVLIFLLIGFGPVWFNEQWTEYRYKRTHGNA